MVLNLVEHMDSTNDNGIRIQCISNENSGTIKQINRIIGVAKIKNEHSKDQEDLIVEAQFITDIRKIASIQMIVDKHC